MSRNQYSGSTRKGLGEWIVQRVSALYLAGCVVAFGVRLTFWPIDDFYEWHEWWSDGAVRVAAALFLFAVVLHAWIGMRSVFLDYLNPFWLRFTMSTLTAVSLVALFVWGSYLLALGGLR